VCPFDVASGPFKWPGSALMYFEEILLDLQKKKKKKNKNKKKMERVDKAY